MWRPDCCSICARICFASSSEKLVRGRQVDREALLLGGDERLELARDLLELRRAALLDQQEQEVAHDLLAAREQLAERRLLRAVVDLGVLEQRAQLGHVSRGRDEVGELLVDLTEAVLVLRCREESALA